MFVVFDSQIYSQDILWILPVCDVTLPDPSPVDVDLHRIGRVKRLVVVQDEDVTSQGVDTSREHGGILEEQIKTSGKYPSFSFSAFDSIIFNVVFKGCG